MHGFKTTAERSLPRSVHGRRGGILIWDLPLRLFHWLLVASVGAAAITGFLAPEWWLNVHRWAGYTIGFLIVFRILWGFWGSWYASFKSFLFAIPETVHHLQALAHGQPSHYAGHNPAGALMVFALLAILGALTISGLIVLGGQENIGVLAGFVDFRVGADLVAIHKILAIILLVLIGGHLMGVFAESFLSRENLVRAMITGRKSAGATAGIAVVSDGTASLPRAVPRAAMIASCVGLAGAGISWWLLRVPPSGYVVGAANASYVSECGDCHYAYHPSLLPASSWKKIMAGLADHFGEDASLDAKTEKDIADYLQAFSSERWDSEAANNFRRVSPGDPLRITATPYWKRRHKAIAKSVFSQKNVGSKGNCIACHADAMTGHFDDERIALPISKVKPKSKIKSSEATKTMPINNGVAKTMQVQLFSNLRRRPR